MYCSPWTCRAAKARGCWKTIIRCETRWSAWARLCTKPIQSSRSLCPPLERLYLSGGRTTLGYQPPVRRLPAAVSACNVVSPSPAVLVGGAGDSCHRRCGADWRGSNRKIQTTAEPTFPAQLRIHCRLVFAGACSSAIHRARSIECCHLERSLFRRSNHWLGAIRFWRATESRVGDTFSVGRALGVPAQCLSVVLSDHLHTFHHPLRAKPP